MTEILDVNGDFEFIARQNPSASRAFVQLQPRSKRVIDGDLDEMSRGELVLEVRRLRAGIREHRDSSGHNLCWHHPRLWGLLPEQVEPQIAVPPWPKFLRGCVHYRQSLDEQAPAAAVHDLEYAEDKEAR